MASNQEKAEAKLESQTEKFDLRRHAFILEHLLEEAELQWKETKNELEGVLTTGKLKGDEIELMRVKAKVECVLEQMKSVKDEGNLESQRWKMRLSENMEKAEFILQEMKSMPGEGLGASGLEMQLEKRIAKSELLLKEMKLAEDERGGESKWHSLFVKNVKDPVLNLQLKEHIVKVESLLGNVKILQEESKMESPMLRIQLMQATEELSFY